MKKHLLCLTALTALSLVAGPAAAQDKPVELRFSHWVPPQHPMHAAAPLPQRQRTPPPRQG